MTKNSNVSKYLEELKQWQSELLELRAIVLSTGLTEEYKWKHPCYTWKGKNQVMLGDFKNFCSISFFNGFALKDPKGLLQKGGEHTQQSRILRFTSLQEIIDHQTIIKAFIQELITMQDNNKLPKQEAAPEIPHPAELTEAFKNNPALKNAFHALTPGRQRDYLILFTGSEDSATRAARIERNIDRILKGFGRNDCTCGLSKKMPQCDGSHKQLSK